MELSVIIVNYNVKYFLEQCLYSVVKATENLDAEIIVVDNCSADGSIVYLQPQFAHVHFIENKKNVGFGKANNQALEIAKGKYILFLNPDTLVPEDCFEKCMAFMERTPNCGALGIKMLDGRGVFLPESKRSFPSPITSFYKLVGLARVFPKSGVFNKYALGNLDENNTHEVDVLAGAFICSTKKIMTELNGFDETFFMYGEDVDLSYRIQLAGYKNYYFSESSIIHFKGESTKKGSLNYVKMFYEAMGVFVQKHYSSGTAILFAFLIKLAITSRAILALLGGLLTKLGMVLTDASVVFLSLWLVEKNWVKYIRDGGSFNQDVIWATIPCFTILFLIAAALSGMYDNLYKPSKAFMASLTSIIVLLAAYSLLPEKYRFSRGVVLTGGIVAGLMITLVRWLLIEFKWIKEVDTEEKKFQQTIVVGSQNEYAQVSKIFEHASLQERLLGRIKINGDNANAIGDIANLNNLLLHLSVKEVVFCEGSLSFKQIIAQITALPKSLNYRFFANTSQCIVGSDSKATTGEILTAEGYFLLHQPYQKRMKRLVDLFFASFVLLSVPLQFFLIKNGLAALKNCFWVILGKKTWVGYIKEEKKLPYLPIPVITHFGMPYNHLHPLNKESLSRLDMIYAKNFDWMQDIKIIFKHYKYLGGA